MVEDTELEEGEAGVYIEETDQQIDPDVAFAYIGEKLHDLLGHHQKEFDGCFTAENLGPKFGAYGSFLPTTKRSPPSMLSTTPQIQVQNNLPNTAVSLQGDSDRFAVQPTACQKAQQDVGSASASKLTFVLPTVHESARCNPTQVSELNEKSEDAKQLSTVAPSNTTDSVKRNASVNSSLEKVINIKSADTEQLSKLARRKPIRVRITMNSKLLLPDDAPTICSPCPSTNHLENNLESQDMIAKSPGAVIRSMTASPVPRSSVLSPLPEYLTLLNINEKEHQDCSTSDNQLMNEDCPDSKSSEKNFKLKKTLPHPKVCEDAEVSARVPHLSMSGNQIVGHGLSYLGVCGEEQPDLGASQLVGLVSVKPEGMPSTGLAVNNKAALLAQDAIKTSFRVPEKGKGPGCCSNQHISLSHLSKGSQIVGSLVKPGNMRSTSGLVSDFKSEKVNVNMQRGFEKTNNTYKDIFGDLSTDDEDNESVCPAALSDCTKKNDYAAIDECKAVATSISAPLDHQPAAISTTAAPIHILENWVYCEDCNKWRLLPLHIDTNSLADNWTCRMINWLPGMNSCEVSEEETTQAVHALYEPIVPENHLKVDVGCHGISTEVCPTKLSGKNFSSISVPVAMKKKKKHGSTKISVSGLQCATKMQQSKPRDFVTEKNRVKMPKFFPEEGALKKSRAIGVSPDVNTRKEPDQSIKDCLPRKHLKTKKNLFQMSAKQPNAKLRVSTGNSSLEMHTADGYYVVNDKRKVREHSESEQVSQVNQASHGSLSQDDQKKKKRMRLNQSGLNNHISSEGSGQPHEKLGTVNGHESVNGHGHGHNLLKLNMHPRKKNLGYLENVDPESSSSKVSSSRRLKVELKCVKASPVASVSSSILYHPKKDEQTMRNRSSQRQDDLVDKSLHKKPEDEPLRSADKSNASCIICESKEDVSSGQKRKNNKCKVLVDNAVKSFKRYDDANMSSESSKCNGNEVKSELFSFEQPMSNQIMGSASGTDKFLSGVVFYSHDGNKTCSSQDTPESQHTIDIHAVSTATANDENVKMINSSNQRETQLHSSTSQTAKRCRVNDFGERNIGTIRKELLNEASRVEKEARSLKYTADRFGDSESACEKVGIYFQSSLKFLNAASLYESTTTTDDRNHAVQIYRSTSKLFEFCGSEFEKLNNMFAVALAYKCMEVAHLRVAYSCYNNASKDLLELQTAFPTGESPSSCFSDVDNLNVAPAEQASSTKGTTSPLAIEDLIIPAQNRPKLIKLFTFTEDVDMAMDSSQKSLSAFIAADANSVNTRGISLVKKALDFSFQDVDEFLRLVRFAMEAISS